MGKPTVQEIRPAAGAGRFYPAEPEFLAKTVDHYLGEPVAGEEPPKAIIAPHGGYIYSGAVAGSAFRCWRKFPGVERVVLIGPSHFYDFPGLALPDASVFVTPLGELELDRTAAQSLRRLDFVRVFEAAHEPEHAIEVELPFVQRLFGEPKIIPLITGTADVAHVAKALDLVWGESETVIVVSADLSHYLDYGSAQRCDAVTARMIENFDYTKLTADQSCGYRAIRGFLKTALMRELRCVTSDLRNSGDTIGLTTEVIGYGAFQFFEQ
jgi:MEMO1 family protein